MKNFMQGRTSVAHYDEILSMFSEEVKHLRDSRILVLVEGKKDRAALSFFGITHVMILSKPLYRVVEEICAQGEKTVCLLTDLDKEGKRLYSRLAAGLSCRGINIDDSFRRFLAENTTLNHIEGLGSYMNKYLSKGNVPQYYD